MRLNGGKSRIEARDDLLTFAQFMMPNADHPDDVSLSQYIVAKHHRAIAAALEQVENGLIPRLIINVPPRHGKSQLRQPHVPGLVHRAAPGRIRSSSPPIPTSCRGISAAKSARSSKTRSMGRCSLAFPSRRHPSIASRPTQGGKLFFVGRGSAITGRGSIGLLIDDPIKDRVEADSLVTRNKLWAWYNQVAKTRLLSLHRLDRHHPDALARGRSGRPADRPAEPGLLGHRRGRNGRSSTCPRWLPARATRWGGNRARRCGRSGSLSPTWKTSAPPIRAAFRPSTRVARRPRKETSFRPTGSGPMAATTARPNDKLRFYASSGPRRLDHAGPRQDLLPDRRRR